MNESRTRCLRKINRTVAHNTLLTYPDFNETFKTCTGTIVFHLGAVISKKGKLVAFYNIKLTGSQNNYTVTDK